MLLPHNKKKYGQRAIQYKSEQLGPTRTVGRWLEPIVALETVVRNERKGKEGTIYRMRSKGGKKARFVVSNWNHSTETGNAQLKRTADACFDLGKK